MSKYIDADKLIAEIDDIIEMAEERWDNEQVTGVKKLRDLLYNKIASLQQEQDMGEVSDDYHTFNELYYYRMLYNAAFFNFLPKAWVHKSKRHHTGEECFGGGWFIVMANLPTGQVSNHYELKDWDLFKVPEKEFADEWDGHTPQEAAKRLHEYLQQEQPNNMIQWIGNNLKEVIDFTGKSPKFGEWFSSWEEYENYVHAHNDILKLFCEDGSHYEVPVGAWIVKTPDGYNVPSIAKYIQQKQSDNWDKQYQEDELQTRFAFYTYKDENNILYLSNVFVEEASRCKGFGTKILQAAEKVAETIGATSIRLRVKQNSQANDWYRKHGYGYLTFEGKYDWLEKNLEYLKPKQEQQEVDLEEEITAYIEQHFHIRYDETLVISNHPLTTYNFEKIARHFYELGINARK